MWTGQRQLSYGGDCIEPFEDRQISLAYVHEDPHRHRLSSVVGRLLQQGPQWTEVLCDWPVPGCRVPLSAEEAVNMRCRRWTDDESSLLCRSGILPSIVRHLIALCVSCRHV